jgi:putative transposase
MLFNIFSISISAWYRITIKYQFNILQCLSYREIEEIGGLRGVNIDHATLQRWVIKFMPILEGGFRKRKRQVNGSWRMDETYIKVKGNQQFPL